MAIFTITTFSDFAGLLTAAQKLASEPDPSDRVRALADLAANGQALTAALRDAGLAPLVEEMAARAQDADRAFADEGQAKEAARALFWQVAPATFADAEAIVPGGLAVSEAVDRMVAAIRASEHAYDFDRTAIAEAYFRAVTGAALTPMIAKADLIAAITPEPWRRILGDCGVQIASSHRIDATTQRMEARIDARADRATALIAEIGKTPPGVPQATILELAHRVAARSENIVDALKELHRAVEIAADIQTRGQRGGNGDGFVDHVLQRLAELTGEGRLDEAAASADAAADRARSGLTQLLDAAVRQHLLAFDAEGAARQIARRVTLEGPEPGSLFHAMRAEQWHWYVQGRDGGPRVVLEVAIALARHTLKWARDPEQQQHALISLGNALKTLGNRESGTERLEEAVATYRLALEKRTRDEAPGDWASLQNNLGAALSTLGARDSGTARLKAAIVAFREALSEPAREPLDRAVTQNNLGVALRRLGERETGTAMLEEAVAAFRAALRWRTRRHVPHEWAETQDNLGIALRALGERESGTVRLEGAVAASRAALRVFTREGAPLDWAETQHNLGRALGALGEREGNTERLEEAISAYRSALEERTRERAPRDWAQTQHNLGKALRALGEREGDTERLEEAIAAQRAALEEMSRERVPLDWARTQTSLGEALRALGQRESGTGRLEEAVTAIRAALEELTRERVPLQWAETQNSLGDAILVLAEREGDTEQLEEAIAAYRSALEEMTRERASLAWARTKAKLAVVHAFVADEDGQAGDPALAEIDAALDALRAAGATSPTSSRGAKAVSPWWRWLTTRLAGNYGSEAGRL